MKEEWKVFIRGVEGRGDKVGKEVSNEDSQGLSFHRGGDTDL